MTVWLESYHKNSIYLHTFKGSYLHNRRTLLQHTVMLIVIEADNELNNDNIFVRNLS